MKFKDLLCLVFSFLVLGVLGCDVASAQGSSGSYGGWRVGAVFADGDGYILPRRDIRVARRMGRVHARQSGYGSAGSTSYGSAGSTSYGSAGSTGNIAPASAEVAPDVPDDSSAEIQKLKDLQHRLADMQREVEFRLAQLERADRVAASGVSNQHRSSFASAASDILKGQTIPSLDEINPSGGVQLASR